MGSLTFSNLRYSGGHSCGKKRPIITQHLAQPRSPIPPPPPPPPTTSTIPPSPTPTPPFPRPPPPPHPLFPPPPPSPTPPPPPPPPINDIQFPSSRQSQVEGEFMGSLTFSNLRYSCGHSCGKNLLLSINTWRNPDSPTFTHPPPTPTATIPTSPTPTPTIPTSPTPTPPIPPPHPIPTTPPLPPLTPSHPSPTPPPPHPHHSPTPTPPTPPHPSHPLPPFPPPPTPPPPPPPWPFVLLGEWPEVVLPGDGIYLQPPDQETRGLSAWAAARSEHEHRKRQYEAQKWLASDPMQEQGQPDGCDSNRHWSCRCWSCRDSRRLASSAPPFCAWLRTSSSCFSNMDMII